MKTEEAGPMKSERSHVELGASLKLVRAAMSRPVEAESMPHLRECCEVRCREDIKLKLISDDHLWNL